ncbi:MAG TPA: hypothetical protein VKG20_12415 [Methylomirabilota bacterium]|nr:hypothetical protein [Methylomirabilota bacterium]
MAIDENDHERRYFEALAADLSLATRWHCICDEWVEGILILRTAIGLIVLGLLGGVVPTGAAGVAYAETVMVGMAAALLSLAVFGFAGAVAARRAAWVPPAPRRQRSPIASAQPASPSI